MVYKLTLTAIFMLGFLSLGAIVNSIGSDSVFVNKAFAAGGTGGW